MSPTFTAAHLLLTVSPPQAVEKMERIAPGTSRIDLFSQRHSQTLSPPSQQPPSLHGLAAELE